MAMPSQPSRAKASWKSAGKPPSRSRLAQYSSSKRAQSFAIASRMRSCSGLRLKSKRSHNRARLLMTLDRLGDEARRLHVLDELPQVARARFLAFLAGHRLVDHHEPPGQQAHASDAPRVVFELLFHARGDFIVVLDERVDHGGRRVRAYDLGLLERAREIKVVGAVARNYDSVTFAVDFVVRLERRVAAHRSEEHTSELQSQSNLVCRLLLEKKKKQEREC